MGALWAAEFPTVLLAPSSLTNACYREKAMLLELPFLRPDKRSSPLAYFKQKFNSVLKYIARFVLRRHQGERRHTFPRRTWRGLAMGLGNAATLQSDLRFGYYDVRTVIEYIKLQKRLAHSWLAPCFFLGLKNQTKEFGNHFWLRVIKGGKEGGTTKLFGWFERFGLVGQLPGPFHALDPYKLRSITAPRKALRSGRGNQPDGI